jgi:hypothetical protein
MSIGGPKFSDEDYRMAYQIEKGIPLVSKARQRPSKYPWDQMKNGDSFFVPGKPKGLYTAAYGRGIKIAVRPEKKRNKEGVRVWKIGDREGTKKAGRKRNGA